MMDTLTTPYRFGSVEYDLFQRTYVMGILNVTPDSFSDGGKFFRHENAVEHGLRMVEDGADFIDIGGESTRPGSEPLPLEEELRRVLPVVEKLAKRISVPISIDTYKSDIAERALDAGATIVNDISGLHFDNRMPEVIASKNASVILMHIQGTPRTMQQNPEYRNLMEEICSYIQTGIDRARVSGIDQIIIDPGIGFGKTTEHNLEIFQRLKELHRFAYPVLVGPSRKNFIGKILDLPIEERLEGTMAAVAVSVINGANIVRVHDVKQIKRSVRMVDAINEFKSKS